MGFWGKIIGTATGVNVADVIDKGTKLIDEAFTNQEEKLAAKQRLLDSVLNDKQSARDMYKVDNSLQKIFALVFLAAYMVITGVMFYVIFWASKDGVTLSDFGITTISTLFGAMSAKINTIVDFLFGSSVENKSSTSDKKS